MPKRKQLIELLAALRILQQGDVPFRGAGICYNLGRFRIAKWNWVPVMNEALESCDWYTGDRDYPIPGNGCEHPCDAYDKFFDKWDVHRTETSSYAKRRFELVDRMIDVCIKHIDSPSSKLSVLK